jgi:hypothetical protein
MKISQSAIVGVCMAIGIVIGMVADRASVRAQPQPADSAGGAWEIHTGTWGQAPTWGYYAIRLNRITGETLILDRQDNKPAENDSWLKLPEETKQPKK